LKKRGNSMEWAMVLILVKELKWNLHDTYESSYCCIVSLTDFRDSVSSLGTVPPVGCRWRLKLGYDSVCWLNTLMHRPQSGFFPGTEQR
jgi:hypothetical protein